MSPIDLHGQYIRIMDDDGDLQTSWSADLVATTTTRTARKQEQLEHFKKIHVYEYQEWNDVL